VTSSLTKWLKAAVALIVLVFLLYTVRGWWTEYKAAPRTGITTGTVEPTTTPAAEKPAESSPADDGTAQPDVLIVTTDGLNFRVDPDATAKNLRGLKEGEKLTVVKKNGDWYQVKTATGETGWITDNPSYTRIEKQ